MSETQARTLTAVGVVAIVSSVIGLVLGLIMVGNLSDYLEESVGVTESALGAVDETLSLIESVTTEVEGAIGSAAQSIGSVSDAATAASGDLQSVADFLGGELHDSIQALLDTMPAAIQTAGVIDRTLSALSFFGVDYDRIEVVIHPTSIVHGLVRFRDGATIAHLGYPDMRVPISYALTYPERAATPVPPLALETLEFHPPDTDTFRMLALGREAGERGGTYPCAYNAANEVAVQAFLEQRIGFLEIAALVEDVLDRVDGAPARDLDDLVEADRRARELVPGG